MLKLIIDVIIAIIIYLVPGLIILSWIDFPNLKDINRIVVALGISLVTVPAVFILVANTFPFLPGLVPWLLLVVLLTGVSLFLRARNQRIAVQWITKWDIHVPKLERFLVFGFLLLFAAFVNLPRIMMFLKGDLAIELGPWDESWHIAELVSVAKTGIPPLHYFFPSLKLGYYYASWIYPAILGNLPGAASVSLLRAMSIHVFIQVLAFVGLFYVIIQYNVQKTWMRLAGLSLVTLMGGFDLFATLPQIDYVDWWIKDPSWLFGKMQISQFSTLYEWVPQHLGAAMALLFLVLLYKNLNLSISIKIVCAAVLLAFSFSSSVFVFLATSILIALGVLSEWRSLWANRKKSLVLLAILAGVFLLVVWNQIFVYAGHSGNFIWSDLRLTVIEDLRGNFTRPFVMADRYLTLLGLPLVAGGVLLIDLGLAFILYLVWWAKRIFSKGPIFSTTEDILLGIYPLVSILLIFLFDDQTGGLNFAMRGFIPAQIVIVLAAIQVIGDFRMANDPVRIRRWLLAYGFACFFIAQSFSTLAEIRTNAKKPVEIALWQECGLFSLIKRTTSDDYCIPNDAARYVYWLNQSTPKNALILENGPFSPDTTTFRWLERIRLVIPEEIARLKYFYNDADFILPREWEQYNALAPGDKNVVDWYQAANFRGKGEQPVYLVNRGNREVPEGAEGPLYQDKFVKIYYLSQSVLNH